MVFTSGKLRLGQPSQACELPKGAPTRAERVARARDSACTAGYQLTPESQSPVFASAAWADPRGPAAPCSDAAGLSKRHHTPLALDILSEAKI